MAQEHDEIMEAIKGPQVFPGAAERTPPTAEEKVAQMTKDEKSNLLYWETRAVDYGGLVASEKMNSEDFEIAKRMSDDGFIRFSRIPSGLWSAVKKYGATCSHVVELTPFAWEVVGILRRQRAERGQHKDIVQPSLEHFESLKA